LKTNNQENLDTVQEKMELQNPQQPESSNVEQKTVTLSNTSETKLTYLIVSK
jgi:hypothetical protein